MINNGMVKRRHLLVLTSTFPRWEGDREPPFVFELSRRLMPDFQVTVLAPRGIGAESKEYMDGLNVIRFPYFFRRLETLSYEGGILSKLKINRWYYLLVPFFMLGQGLALIKLLRSQPFDIIHAHWLIPQGVVAMMCRLFMRKPPMLLCTSHGGDLFSLRGGFFTMLKRKVIEHSDAVTVVSQAMKKPVADMGLCLDKIYVISMGVNAKSIFTPDSKILRCSNDLLFVGRLVEKKGLAYLLEAMPLILNRHPQTRLTVVGSGPEMSSLRSLTQKLGITNQVNFFGSVANTNLPDLYRRSAIFIAPSIVTRDGDQEGLGLVIAEALACECPVVASRLPAIADLIDDKVSGLLASPNDPADLACKINQLLDDSNLGLRLGQAGRQRVLSHFDWERIAERYSALLQELIYET